MTSLEVVGIISIILISVFALVGIIISIPLVKLLIRIKSLAEKLEKNLFPVVENLNQTVSRLNSEIASINDITQNVGSIILQVEKVIKLARVLITSPVIKIISTFAGVMQAMSDTKNNKEKTKEG
ncbi:MAG TPA: hypothetical protein GXZ93_00445 [Actinobacteria bacterium]|jgi:hypothetical protein|nr:hypothetical protein [Actinomycetota bacterium]